jgi:hypothetical protein
MREFFDALERRYGNLHDLFDDGPSGETIVSSPNDGDYDDDGDGVLRTDDLVRLFRHEATALHVPNFYHPDTASSLGDELIRESSSSSSWSGGGRRRRREGGGRGGGIGGGGVSNWKVSTSRGLESSDVYTLGEHVPYNVAVASATTATAGAARGIDDDGGRRREDGDDDDGSSNSSSTDDYFEGVRREFRSRRLRRRFQDDYDDDDDVDDGYRPDRYRLWPLDKLRLELEEAWPAGAGLAREGGTTGSRRPFGGGLPRIMRGPTRWRRGFVHVDELGPLDPENGLFTANIYLKMPTPRHPPPSPDTEGNASSSISSAPPPSDSGALYIWPLGVRRRWDWYRVSCIFFFSNPRPPFQMTGRTPTPTYTPRVFLRITFRFHFY